MECWKSPGEIDLDGDRPTREPGEVGGKDAGQHDSVIRKSWTGSLQIEIEPLQKTDRNVTGSRMTPT
jgi:hypothetical protein